ncbi:hypothetical protein EDC04DRAFT_2609005 [Pisolithus marmoratus]|nr:hypothetical protein EDC04DRAFT_2609005 [Pisolithus marmoratus]
MFSCLSLCLQPSQSPVVWHGWKYTSDIYLLTYNLQKGRVLSRGTFCHIEMIINQLCDDDDLTLNLAYVLPFQSSAISRHPGSPGGFRILSSEAMLSVEQSSEPSSEDSGDIVALHLGVDNVQGKILEQEWNDESEAWLMGQHLGWLQGYQGRERRRWGSSDTVTVTVIEGLDGLHGGLHGRRHVDTCNEDNCSGDHYKRLLLFSIVTGSVHVFAISIDGIILAAGGTHGIQLWNIQTHKKTSIMTHLESCGIVSSAIWIKTKYALGETLCYGTALGYVMFVWSSPVEEICAQRLGAGLEVTCLAWDPSSPESSHIAVGTCDHAIQVLSLSSSLQLHLYIFGLYDGKVGSAAIYLKKGMFVINNATDGFTLYHLNGADPI